MTEATIARAWVKAEQHAGHVPDEPEVEYWLVAARGDLWGERRYDDLDEAQREAQRHRADGDEVRIAKVTVTRTREWLTGCPQTRLPYPDAIERVGCVHSLGHDGPHEAYWPSRGVITW